MRKSKNRYFHHILVSPGDAPGAITLNVVWVEREFDVYKFFRSMYPSIINSFPVIRTASAKNRRFHVPQPTFLFPLETPRRLSRNMLHGWKDNSMLAKPVAAYTIFNSFRVIRCLSQCVSPKVAILPHFCFPWGRPCGNHAKCCRPLWAERELDAYKLSRWMCLSNYNRFPDRARYWSNIVVFSYHPCIQRPRLRGFPTE